jgi:ABC-type uncharacterized transport system permease subunit
MGWLDILTFTIHNSVVFATPLILAALGGVFSERSGVVNIGLEGLMIMGAFSGAIFTIWAVDWGMGAFSSWFAILAAIIIGAIFALPHAVATITFKADQIVSGVALNFLAAGLSIFLVKSIFDGAGQTPTLPDVARLSKIEIPILGDIPYIGQMFFRAYPTSYIAFAIVAIVFFFLFKTPFGLRLRSVGEHPRAADTMGINVARTRYTAVILSGALAAMGGAIYAMAITGNFSHNTISGHGFMALAALIFGKWHPVGAMGAALFFGMANALAAIGQTIGLTDYVPRELLIMFPYLITIVALASFVGRADSPAAIGKPYDTLGR